MNSEGVQLGDVVFDRKTGALTGKGGADAQLRHKSREVLRFLVEHQGRTVSKAEIMEAVWKDVIVSDESLVQCIADIRRVIGQDARRVVGRSLATADVIVEEVGAHRARSGVGERREALGLGCHR